MKGLKLIALAAFGLGAATAASAQTAFDPNTEAGKMLNKACSADIEKHCSGLASDEERFQCSVQKETQLSKPCQAAMAEFGAAIQQAGGDIGG